MKGKRSILEAGLIVLLLVSCQQTEGQEPVNQSEPQADWPVLEAAELIDQADLVAQVEVVRIEPTEVELAKGEVPVTAQLSELTINHIFYGDSEEAIVLEQVTDFLEDGETYIVFLEETNGDYTQIDANSFVLEEDGQYAINIPGMRNESVNLEEFSYDLEEIATVKGLSLPDMP